MIHQIMSVYADVLGTWLFQLYSPIYVAYVYMMLSKCILSFYLIWLTFQFCYVHKENFEECFYYLCDIQLSVHM
jgi:hypothetical protein